MAEYNFENDIKLLTTIITERRLNRDNQYVVNDCNHFISMKSVFFSQFLDVNPLKFEKDNIGKNESVELILDVNVSDLKKGLNKHLDPIDNYHSYITSIFLVYKSTDKIDIYTPAIVKRNDRFKGLMDFLNDFENKKRNNHFISIEEYKKYNDIFIPKILDIDDLKSLCLKKSYKELLNKNHFEDWNINDHINHLLDDVLLKSKFDDDCFWVEVAMINNKNVVNFSFRDYNNINGLARNRLFYEKEMHEFNKYNCIYDYEYKNLYDELCINGKIDLPRTFDVKKPSKHYNLFVYTNYNCSVFDSYDYGFFERETFDESVNEFVPKFSSIKGSIDGFQFNDLIYISKRRTYKDHITIPFYTKDRFVGIFYKKSKYNNLYHDYDFFDKKTTCATLEDIENNSYKIYVYLDDEYHFTTLELLNENDGYNKNNLVIETKIIQHIDTTFHDRIKYSDFKYIYSEFDDIVNTEQNNRVFPEMSDNNYIHAVLKYYTLLNAIYIKDKTNPNKLILLSLTPIYRDRYVIKINFFSNSDLSNFLKKYVIFIDYNVDKRKIEEIKSRIISSYKGILKSGYTDVNFGYGADFSFPTKRVEKNINFHGERKLIFDILNCEEIFFNLNFEKKFFFKYNLYITLDDNKLLTLLNYIYHDFNIFENDLIDGFFDKYFKYIFIKQSDKNVNKKALDSIPTKNIPMLTFYMQHPVLGYKGAAELSILFVEEILIKAINIYYDIEKYIFKKINVLNIDIDIKSDYLYNKEILSAIFPYFYLSIFNKIVIYRNLIALKDNNWISIKNETDFFNIIKSMNPCYFIYKNRIEKCFKLSVEKYTEYNNNPFETGDKIEIIFCFKEKNNKFDLDDKETFDIKFLINDTFILYDGSEESVKKHMDDRSNLAISYVSHVDKSLLLKKTNNGIFNNIVKDCYYVLPPIKEDKNTDTEFEYIKTTENGIDFYNCKNIKNDFEFIYGYLLSYLQENFIQTFIVRFMSYSIFSKNDQELIPFKSINEDLNSFIDDDEKIISKINRNVCLISQRFFRKSSYILFIDFEKYETLIFLKKDNFKEYTADGFKIYKDFINEESIKCLNLLFLNNFIFNNIDDRNIYSKFINFNLYNYNVARNKILFFGDDQKYTRINTKIIENLKKNLNLELPHTLFDKYDRLKLFINEFNNFISFTKTFFHVNNIDDYKNDNFYKDERNTFIMSNFSYYRNDNDFGVIIFLPSLNYNSKFFIDFISKNFNEKEKFIFDFNKPRIIEFLNKIKSDLEMSLESYYYFYTNTNYRNFKNLNIVSNTVKIDNYIIFYDVFIEYDELYVRVCNVLYDTEDIDYLYVSKFHNREDYLYSLLCFRDNKEKKLDMYKFNIYKHFIEKKIDYSKINNFFDLKILRNLFEKRYISRNYIDFITEVISDRKNLLQTYIDSLKDNILHNYSFSFDLTKLKNGEKIYEHDINILFKENFSITDHNPDIVYLYIISYDKDTFTFSKHLLFIDLNNLLTCATGCNNPVLSFNYNINNTKVNYCLNLSSNDEYERYIDNCRLILKDSKNIKIKNDSYFYTFRFDMDLKKVLKLQNIENVIFLKQKNFMVFFKIDEKIYFFNLLTSKYRHFKYKFIPTNIYFRDKIEEIIGKTKNNFFDCLNIIETGMLFSEDSYYSYILDILSFFKFFNKTVLNDLSVVNINDLKSINNELEILNVSIDSKKTDFLIDESTLDIVNKTFYNTHVMYNYFECLKKIVYIHKTSENKQISPLILSKINHKFNEFFSSINIPLFFTESLSHRILKTKELEKYTFHINCFNLNLNTKKSDYSIYGYEYFFYKKVFFDIEHEYDFIFLNKNVKSFDEMMEDSKSSKEPLIVVILDKTVKKLFFNIMFCYIENTNSIIQNVFIFYSFDSDFISDRNKNTFEFYDNKNIFNIKSISKRENTNNTFIDDLIVIMENGLSFKFVYNNEYDPKNHGIVDFFEKRQIDNFESFNIKKNIMEKQYDSFDYNNFHYNWFEKINNIQTKLEKNNDNFLLKNKLILKENKNYKKPLSISEDNVIIKENKITDNQYKLLRSIFTNIDFNIIEHYYEKKFTNPFFKSLLTTKDDDMLKLSYNDYGSSGYEWNPYKALLFVDLFNLL